MVKIPPYLKKGDTIGIVCPAGYMPAEKVQSCVCALENWGFRVKLGTTVGAESPNYFSATDEIRLHDLQTMMDDDEVNAVLFGRGGYGLTRIIDTIDFKKFTKQPKWLIGFSDITILHCHVHTNYKISTMHAPMAGAFNDEDVNNKYLQSLKKVMLGKHTAYHVAPHEYNRRGEAIGELIGGNLSLLAHCIGTPSDFKTKGKILFIEDVGEYLYNTDRMLHQLKRAGKFDRLAALIVGGFTNMKDTDRPFGTTVEVIIRELVREYSFPVCFGFPISHDRENYAVKIGEGYKLKVGKSRVSLVG